MKRISEVAKDPCAWGLLFCGWVSIYLGWSAVALVVITIFLTQQRMESLFKERIKNAVMRGEIKLAEVTQ